VALCLNLSPLGSTNGQTAICDLPELGRVLQAIGHRNGLHRDGFPPVYSVRLLQYSVIVLCRRRRVGGSAAAGKRRGGRRENGKGLSRPGRKFIDNGRVTRHTLTRARASDTADTTATNGYNSDGVCRWTSVPNVSSGER